MKTLNQWMDVYAESHQNPTNIKIHTIAVPLIFFASVGMLWLIPNPEFMGGQKIRIFHLILGLALTFYMRLGKKIFNTMLVFFLLTILIHYLGYWIFFNNYIWVLVSIFILAWVAQFHGHNVEGKKPSFFTDLQFLLIGPVWVLKKMRLV
ncbi:MAG: DUF962 domain-containing protein [Bacteriovoracaceae bacterium]|nr:DUF962 domain-containing protein [Bacteriovoracaceae bacterium]